jgi:nicotinamide mononucleotide transporter
VYKNPNTHIAAGLRHRLVGLEALAVAANLLFTFLYLRENDWCYFFGIIGPAGFLILCYNRQLYAEIALHLLYIALAIYGWLHLDNQWTKREWSEITHLLLILAGLPVALLGGHLLARLTDARFPYTDSLVTVTGIIGTWAMVNYVHENWLYFIVVNSVSVFLCLSRTLYLGSAMYLLYLLMALDGYFSLHWFYS